MFSIRSRHASTNSGESSRMKPARQTSSIPASRSAASSAASKSRLRLKAAAIDDGGRDAAVAAHARGRPRRDCRRGRARSRPDSARPSPRRSARRDCCRARRSGPPSSARASAIEIELAREHDSRSCRAARCGRASRRVSPSALQQRADLGGRAGIDDQHHADPAVEGAEHLRCATGPASQRKTGGTAIAARSISAARWPGSTRGMFSTSPPPVMWASALTAPVSRIAARQERT